MPGPLVEVNTVVSGITLDVNRQLYLGPDSTIQLIRPKKSEADGWEVLLEITENFDRIVGDEQIRGDGKDVIYQVADVEGDVGPLLRTKDLHLRTDTGNLYKVDRVPAIAYTAERELFKILFLGTTNENRNILTIQESQGP